MKQIIKPLDLDHEYQMGLLLGFSGVGNCFVQAFTKYQLAMYQWLSIPSANLLSYSEAGKLAGGSL